MLFLALALLPSLIAPQARAAAPAIDDLPLRNLTAGSVLRVLKPISVRANEDQARLRADTRLSCSIRAAEPKPFERIIPDARELRISGIQRSSLSSRRVTAVWTRILLDSAATPEIICAQAAPQVALKIRDFREAIRGSLELIPPEHPAELTDSSG